MSGTGSSPFFVVGCGRSGSTMLRLMLDAHPELAVPGESHFIPPLWRARRRFRRGRRLDRGRLAAAVASTPHFGHWKISREAYLARVAALGPDATFAHVIDAAFMANAEHHGKTRWADKTPIYVRHIPLLAELFPDARFVHLIRDGRDVAMSYLSLPWGPTTVAEAAWKWRRDVRAGRASGERLGSARYREIRYEELVEHPRDILTRLCAFVGLEFDEGMLAHHREVDRNRLAPATGLLFHERAARPPAVGARNWREEMMPPHVREFEAIAGALLTELGYERVERSRHPIPAMTAAGRVLGYRARELAGAAKKRVSRGRIGADATPG